MVVVLVVHGLPGTSKTSICRTLLERERFREEFVVVSKDRCKAALLRLRDDESRGNAWRDHDSLRARLAEATLAETSSGCKREGVGPFLDEQELELESRCAERIVELATMCPSPSCPDDDVLNSWSYQVMLAVTEAILWKRRSVILDAPLYRLEVARGLGEILSRTCADVFVLECCVDDEKIWDDRLRKRKQGEDDVVNKPGSVREVMAIYVDQKDRREECDAVRRVIEQWFVKGGIRINTGASSIGDAVDAVERLMAST